VGEASATACLLLLLLLEELKVGVVGCEQQLPLVPQHPPSACAVQCRCCHPCFTSAAAGQLRLLITICCWHLNL
jgi:hypothetical protein